MINNNNGLGKSSNDNIELIRQKLGPGFTDKPARTHKKKLGKDDFIKLMSVQLQHQDPLSPMKNEQMAAQLAQFSGLEQMQNVNRNLESMTENSKSRDSLMASSLIGKSVFTDSAKFELQKDATVELEFDLPADVVKGAVSIVDGQGNVIREMPFDKLEKGRQRLPWNGVDDDGRTAKPGDYSFRVTAYDEAERPVKAKTEREGIVSGVEFEKGMPVLLVGNERILMDTVSRIENAGAARPAGKTADTPGNNPAAAGMKPETKQAATEAAATPAAASARKPAPKAAPEVKGVEMSWPMQGSEAKPQRAADLSGDNAALVAEAMRRQQQQYAARKAAAPAAPSEAPANVDPIPAELAGMGLFNPGGE